MSGKLMEKVKYLKIHYYIRCNVQLNLINLIIRDKLYFIDKNIVVKLFLRLMNRKIGNI